MTGFVAGPRRQLAVLAVQPDYWMVLLTAPLLGIVFQATVINADRPDLLATAVLAPALLTMWAMSLFVSGEVVVRDREDGLLEPTLATPTSFAAVTTGRIVAVTTVSLLGFVESWLVAWLAFGVTLPIARPLAFTATVVVSAFAMAGTALAASALFVASTGVRRFQNSLSYPFYVLGGVLVPVAFLPGWAHPVSRVLFLSWSSDLLRDTLAAGPLADLPMRLAVIGGLGAAGWLAGRALLARMEVDARRSGSVAFR